ncbi:GTP-binding protein [Methylohalomonas lacus]|uniref:GTPase Der n=1 Tax=Methylohalomonas lacus TaxID=398773 RepID=A0AAE3L0A0_9GAMM|nr:ribosome biogenesis GTPase Der [Methylohalomonas lacus]MCS3902124.1 GTP-binding protein [Methylohalomonas lacus]
MTAVVVIVGRPNVGKSTLFNRLTNSDRALVDDQPGVTRDRIAGEIRHGQQRCLLVDTGGLGHAAAEDPALAERVTAHSLQAVHEADLVLWLVDGRTGPTVEEQELAGQLRPLGERLRLVVNKTEGTDSELACAEFYQLGVGEPLAVSAQRGSGIPRLLDTLFSTLPAADSAAADADRPGELSIAVLGRPNAGKSTLINRLLGEERMLTFDRPGTTRDSIDAQLERDGRRYTLIDTAGVRRRSQVSEALEKISVIRTLKAIDSADLVILVVDAHTGITEQDAHLLGMAVDRGKAIIIAINKWDGLGPDQRQQVQAQLDQRLVFADYARVHFISALHGSGVGEMFASAAHIGELFDMPLNTALLTSCMERALEAHQPPLVRGRRIKLRYAHLGGRRPLRVIVHGNQVEHLPHHYKRYLARSLREQLQLEGMPLLLEFKQGENPYAGRKNPPRWERRSRRRK